MRLFCPCRRRVSLRPGLLFAVFLPALWWGDETVLSLSAKSHLHQVKTPRLNADPPTGEAIYISGRTAKGKYWYLTSGMYSSNITTKPSTRAARK